MSIQENVFQTTFEAKLEKIKTILDMNPHPNIAQIKKIHVRDNGDAYGEYDQYTWNLKDYLKSIEHNWLSQQQIYNILNQIVQGYQHLRKFKIVHRDLCLETIFVEQLKDNIIIIKIGNFELASIGKARMSSTAGRLLFQAPEIYQIQNEYNEKCDIYSLGILLYYLCYRQEFHIKQLTKQNLDQFHIDLRNQKFKCPSINGISQECRELLEKMIVCDDNDRISWDELYMHNILESNYMIINYNYYIQLGFSNKGQIEFKIINLKTNEYCCQEQIFSYGAVLNQLMQIGFIKYMGTSINNLNLIYEILINPNFQLLDIKQSIIMDDNLQNIIHQIQQYFPKCVITKDQLLTEINNLIQSKSTSNNNPSGQKIKILSKQIANPDQQNQSYQYATQIPPVLNVQPQQQNLSNILPVQTQNNNEEDVFGLQIGDQQQEQNKQQFNLIQSNQLPKNNQQFQPNTNFQDNQFKRQSVLLNQPQTNTGNFKTNHPTTFNNPGQMTSIPAGKVNQQELNNFQSQLQSKSTNPQTLQNFQTPKISDNQGPNSSTFQNFQTAKQQDNQGSNNFRTAKLSDNQAPNPLFQNSSITKPSENLAPKPLFQNSSITKPSDNQAPNQPQFQNSQIPKPTENINVFQSQKQTSSSFQNSPGFQQQFPVQRASNFISQPQNSAVQVPLSQTAKATSNFNQFPSNQNQPAQQQQSQNQFPQQQQFQNQPVQQQQTQKESVQQQQFQNQPVQQQQFQNNQPTQFLPNSNSGKQFNFDQKKFQNPQPPTTPQQNVYRGTVPVIPNMSNQFSKQINAGITSEKNGVTDSQRMRQTTAINTQLTREYEDWQSLTVKSQNCLEQSKNFHNYQNIYICLYYLNKWLIQKIQNNQKKLNDENEGRAQKYNFLIENNFTQSVQSLDKANEQLIKQIELNKQNLQLLEKDEILKSYLKQLLTFELEMKAREGKQLF